MRQFKNEPNSAFNESEKILSTDQGSKGGVNQRILQREGGFCRNEIAV
jgi:hypothetical protein